MPKTQKLTSKLIRIAQSAGMSWAKYAHIIDYSDKLPNNIDTAVWMLDHKGREKIVFHTDFLSSQTVKTLAWVLKHEVLHSALYRTVDAKVHWIVANIALDAVINKILYLSDKKSTIEVCGTLMAAGSYQHGALSIVNPGLSQQAFNAMQSVYQDLYREIYSDPVPSINDYFRNTRLPDATALARKLSVLLSKEEKEEYGQKCKNKDNQKNKKGKKNKGGGNGSSSEDNQNDSDSDGGSGESDDEENKSKAKAAKEDKPEKEENDVDNQEQEEGQDQESESEDDSNDSDEESEDFEEKEIDYRDNEFVDVVDQDEDSMPDNPDSKDQVDRSNQDMGGGWCNAGSSNDPSQHCSHYVDYSSCEPRGGGAKREPSYNSVKKDSGKIKDLFESCKDTISQSMRSVCLENLTNTIKIDSESLRRYVHQVETTIGVDNVISKIYTNIKGGSSFDPYPKVLTRLGLELVALGVSGPDDIPLYFNEGAECKKKICVYIDTSPSMIYYFPHIARIAEFFDSCEECELGGGTNDGKYAFAEKVYEIKDWEGFKACKNFPSGWGTSFDELFRSVIEVASTDDVESFIIVTDGESRLDPDLAETFNRLGKNAYIVYIANGGLSDEQQDSIEQSLSARSGFNNIMGGLKMVLSATPDHNCTY